MLQTKLHLNTSLPGNIKKLQCTYCPKKFLSKSALKAHTKFIHQHLNTFNCPYENCSKFFNTQYRLDIHMMIHKGVKPYKCDLCNKTFTEQGTLRTYLVTHSTIKPFKCELCDYTCKTNPQLRHHYKKEHNDENYYRCPKCFMKFNKKAELKHHFGEHLSLDYEDDNAGCFKSVNDYSQGSFKDTIDNSQIKSELSFQVVSEIQFGVYAMNH